jgi:steroid 5-alpha reductase family enzyme
MNVVDVCTASLAILVVVLATTFLIGRRIGRYNVVDAAWNVGFVGNRPGFSEYRSRTSFFVPGPRRSRLP